MKEFLGQAADLLESGKEFVYVTIISSAGSTPRGAGSKMIVLPDSIIGTIGGGGLEYQIMQFARETVMKDKSTHIQNWDLSADNAADSTFICGGQMEFLITYISPNDENAKLVFRKAAEAAHKGYKAVIYYVVDQRLEATKPLQILLNLHGNTLIGEYEQVGFLKEEVLKSTLRASLHSGDVEGALIVSDEVTSRGVMYLFGGGHVSQEVAYQAVHQGFRVIVIDDREEFANENRFPGCEFVIVEDYDEHLPDFEVNENSYILIITRGHKNDRYVLKWALTKDPFYLGMIGSVSKRDTSYERLIEEGASPERLAAVYAPIGLEIGAETPAEIAVAVMAEIIQVRAEKL